GRTGDTFHDRSVADLATFAREARSAAGGAGLRHFGLDGSLPAAGRLLKGDLDRMFDVLTAFAGDRPSPRPFEIEAGKAAGLAREEGVEEVAEVADSGSAGAPACLRLILPGELLLPLDAFPVGAKLIVFRPFLRVTQHFVSLVDQLEAVGGLRVFVDVRVVLPSKTPIGGLDLLLAGGPGDAQGLVVVLVFRGSHSSIRIDARIAACRNGRVILADLQGCLNRRVLAAMLDELVDEDRVLPEMEMDVTRQKVGRHESLVADHITLSVQHLVSGLEPTVVAGDPAPVKLVSAV